MRVFARKQNSVSLLSPPREPKTTASFEINSNALRDSFRGWLDRVAPATNGTATLKAPTFKSRVPRLTVLDIMRVNHATIREGESHCIWPPFVLFQFQKADIITESQITHYELKDANLRKLS